MINISASFIKRQSDELKDELTLKRISWAKISIF